eukprot:978748-Pleurochrysis_carterae.AAC.2
MACCRMQLSELPHPNGTLWVRRFNSTKVLAGACGTNVRAAKPAGLRRRGREVHVLHALGDAERVRDCANSGRRRRGVRVYRGRRGGGAFCAGGGRPAASGRGPAGRAQAARGARWVAAGSRDYADARTAVGSSCQPLGRVGIAAREAPKSKERQEQGASVTGEATAKKLLLLPALLRFKQGRRQGDCSLWSAGYISSGIWSWLRVSERMRPLDGLTLPGIACQAITSIQFCCTDAAQVGNSVSRMRALMQPSGGPGQGRSIHQTR